MKALVSALIVCLFALTACAPKPVERDLSLGSDVALSAAVHYMDCIFVNAQKRLEVIATTPEVKEGDWPSIKEYLTRLEDELPGVYFFVLPDGNFYTTKKDHTNLNLSNRGYFKSLFAGNAVKGYPIYSRSTGRKSALVAVPVLDDGKVIGALGISIFLDNLAERVSRALKLPPNYTWFVLNSDGSTILDRDPEFIFMNALSQGSPSLRDAITESLMNDSGEVQYKLETARYGEYKKLPNMDWWMFVVRVQSGKMKVQPQVNISLEQFVPELQDALLKIDKSLATWIQKSNIDYESEGQIRALLGRLIDDNRNIVEAAYVDQGGILRYIAPLEYKNYENVDISAQAHVLAMRKNPKPMFTSGFMVVEDFLAVLDTHPVFDQNKQFSGSINLLIRPALLIEPLLKQTTIPDGYELWVMQTDGMIIYDRDESEVGKMLFSDVFYEDYGQLRELGRKIVSETSGEGSYLFLAPGHDERVIKNAIWRTVKLHHREWRVVLAYRPYESR